MFIKYTCIIHIHYFRPKPSFISIPFFGSHHSNEVKKEEEQRSFDTRSSIRSYCNKNISVSTLRQCNTTTTKQLQNQQHEDAHVEDQTNLSLMVRRLQAHVSDRNQHHAKEFMALWQENAQLQEGNRFWWPRNETLVGAKVKPMTIEMSRTTIVGVR